MRERAVSRRSASPVDIERAEQLTREAYKAVEYLFLRAIAREDRPMTIEPPEAWDWFAEFHAGNLLLAEEALGCTMATDEFTRGPYRTLTEGLARARLSLADITDPPRVIAPHVAECLRLVDAALAALDLSPFDPLVRAAA